MIYMHSKYANMHKNGKFNALFCINVVIKINCMLAVSVGLWLWILLLTGIPPKSCKPQRIFMKYRVIIIICVCTRVI